MLGQFTGCSGRCGAEGLPPLCNSPRGEISVAFGDSEVFQGGRCAASFPGLAHVLPWAARPRHAESYNAAPITRVHEARDDMGAWTMAKRHKTHDGASKLAGAKGGEGDAPVRRKPGKSPADDLRRDWHVVSFMNLHAWFAESPRGIGSLVSECLRECEAIYGDGMCDVSCPRRSLPRDVADRVVEHLASAPYGPDFRFRLSELPDGALVGHLRENPGTALRVQRPWTYEDERRVFELEWRPHDVRDPQRSHPWGAIRIQMSVGRALRAEVDRFRALLDRMMERCAELGAVFATLSLDTTRELLRFESLTPTGHSYAQSHDVLTLPHWDQSGMVIVQGHIPGASWRTLLGPKHLHKLGGRDAFTRELVVEGDRWLGHKVNARPYGEHHLEVELVGSSQFLSDHWLLAVRGLEFDPGSRFDRLNARLAKAGLIFWQKPDYLEITAPWLSERAEKRAAEEAPVRHEQVFASVEAYLAYLGAHPPRSIRDVAVMPNAHERRWVTKNAGTHTTAFVVGPEKGDKLHSIWARSVKKGLWPLEDPILVGGPTRSSANFVFDSDHEGFDGFFNEKPPRPVQRARPYLCAKCGHDHFRVMAIFSYDEDDWIEDQEHADIAENLYHWFTLRATCGRCKLAAEIASIECA